MEKLSDRIQTLKPSQNKRLIADGIDTLIYLLTLIPLINVFNPIFNVEDFSWFRAIIVGSLIFILLNYFIRYFIPVKTKGKTIGKLIMKTKVVDFYGYEVKPSQLLYRESIYIFLPIAIFSKFELFNYLLLVIWFLIIAKGLYNSYILMPRSRNLYIGLGRKSLIAELELDPKEIPEDKLDIFGGLVKTKIKERKNMYKEERTELIKKHKEALTTLKTSQTSEVESLTDKEAIYQKKVAQKLALKSLQGAQKNELLELEQSFTVDLVHINQTESEKGNTVYERNLPEKPHYLNLQEFVAFMPGFLEEANSIVNFKDEKEVTTFIDKFNIDKLPSVFKKMNTEFLTSIHFVHAIENNDGFIFDVLFHFKKTKTRKLKIKNSDTEQATKEEIKERKAKLKYDCKELKAKHKEALVTLKSVHTNEILTLSDKLVISEKKAEQKLAFKSLKDAQKHELLELEQVYTLEEYIIEYSKTRTLKAQAIHSDGAVTIQFKEPKMSISERLQKRLMRKARENQGRSILEVLSNTVVVDEYKFDKFYEEHRSEE